MIVPDPAVVGGKRTKLLDFGIAKLGSERLLPNQAQTTTKTVMGTLLYMSPEQCRSARLADGRSDVYSLGIMLYEMLTGRPPFLGESEVEVITMHLQELPRPLSDVSPRTPPPLARLVHRMLAKENEKRPTMREAASQLDALMRQFTDGDAPSETAVGSDSGLGFAPTLAGPPGSQGRSIGPTRSWRSGVPMRVGSLALVGSLSLLIGMQVGQRKPAARPSSQSEQLEHALHSQTASPPLPPPTSPTAATPAAPSAAPAQPAAVVSVAAAAQVAGARPASAGLTAAAEDAGSPPAAKGSSPGAPPPAGIVRAGTRPAKEKKPGHSDRLTAEAPAEPSARPVKSTTDVKTTRHDTTRTVDD